VTAETLRVAGIRCDGTDGRHESDLASPQRQQSMRIEGGADGYCTVA
jgi:hypothetical protein